MEALDLMVWVLQPLMVWAVSTTAGVGFVAGLVFGLAS